MRAEDAAPPEVRARAEQLPALLVRVAEITVSERLQQRGARALRIDDWSPPPDPTTFSLTIEVELSGRDAEHEYNMSCWLTVCTPSWIATRVHEMGPMWVPAPLVLPRWDPTLVQRALDELVRGGGDENWSQYVARLSRVLDEYR